MKLKFWEKFEVEQAIEKAMHEVEKLKRFLKTQPCPCCGSNGDYTIVVYEIGLKGWETRFICNKCKTAAILNNTGFNFQFGSKTK